MNIYKENPDTIYEMYHTKHIKWVNVATREKKILSYI